MLINFNEVSQIYLICGKTDLRRGIDGLAGIVEEKFSINPHCSNLFLFCGTRKDRFKALFWENDGFVLLYKRFENGKMQWPNNQDEARKLTPIQLNRLLTGWALDRSIHDINPPKNPLNKYN